MQIEKYHAEADMIGTRLDQFLSTKLSVSRSSAQSLIEKGNVTCNGIALKKNYKLMGNETFEITRCDPTPCEAVPQEIPLDIVYEDDDLLIVNKSAGMVVHPAAGNWDGTLVNALLAHCGNSLSGINGVYRPGIVHRLDKDTSGLMLVAKNDMAHTSLAAQIKEHSAHRIYHAIIYGHLREAEGFVDAPIGRHKTDRKRMAVTTEHSRNAITHYRTIAEYPGFAYIECKLETGRTHQIRVHMAHLGHPVVGDPVYGKGRNPMGLLGQCLHSKCIEFVHPRSGKAMHLESDLPNYFKDVLKRIDV